MELVRITRSVSGNALSSSREKTIASVAKKKSSAKVILSTASFVVSSVEVFSDTYGSIAESWANLNLIFFLL